MGEEQFEAGDVVRLKSGGPAMTIKVIDSKGALCVWFPNGGDEVRAKYFAEVTLEHRA